MAQSIMTQSHTMYSIAWAATASGLMCVASQQPKLFNSRERARISAVLTAVNARTPKRVYQKEQGMFLWVCSKMVNHIQVT